VSICNHCNLCIYYIGWKIDVRKPNYVKYVLCSSDDM